MKYIHIIIFLLTHDLTELKKYWEADILKKDFNWISLIKKYKRTKSNGKKFLCWWRLLNEMYKKGNNYQKHCAKRINTNLSREFGCDIGLGATIGRRIYMPHCIGIVITKYAIIGDNFHIMQNVTIGQNKGSKNPCILIGNNSKILTGSCVVGEKLRIGDNVTIGAMSFVNKDIPNNCIVYTEKTNKIIKVALS